MIDERHIIRLSEDIARAFDPDAIILFGSYAYGMPTEQSDEDLQVIMPFEGKSRDKRLEIWNTVRPTFPVDILVRRQDDTQRRYQECDPLIREVIDQRRVMYELNGARMALGVAHGRGSLRRAWYTAIGTDHRRDRIRIAAGD